MRERRREKKIATTNRTKKNESSDEWKYIYRTSHAERERERNTSTAAICVPDCYLLT